jgi:hypothetical protein
MTSQTSHRPTRVTHWLTALFLIGLTAPLHRVDASRPVHVAEPERVIAPLRTIRAEGDAADAFVSGFVRHGAIGLANVDVNVYSTSTGGRVTGTTSAADGSYNFFVSNGTYTVTAQLPGYTIDSPRRITVTTNYPTLNFSAQPILGTVTGTVRADGAGLSGVTVSAVAGSQVITTALSQGTGRFSLGLYPGTYTLTAALPGFSFDGPFVITTPVSATNGITFTATRLFYTISGLVTSSGAPLSGVQLTCDGRNAVSGANGAYLLTGVRYGPCILAPTLNGYTFSPAFIPLTVTSSLIDQNFVATPIPVFTISGRVIDADSGEGLSGVQVTDGARTTFTDAGGFYVLNGVPAGNYTISAAKSGYSLSSPTTVIVANANVAGINFTARQTVSVHNINGRVKPFSTGIASTCVSGVQIAYGIGSAVTQADGTFTLLGLPAGAYALTPIQTGCVFTPTTRLITITNTTVNNVEFVEVVPPPNTYSIFGRATTESGAGLPGVRVVYGAGSVQSDAQGNFTISNLPSAAYTLTPTLSGYRFEPLTTTVTISNANAVVLNMVGRAAQFRQMLPVAALNAPQQICNVPGADCGLEPDNAVRAGATLLPTRPGTYYAQIGSSADSRDVYGLNLDAGVRYRFTVTHRAIGDVNLYLYDATTSSPLVSVATPGTGNETLTFTPAVSGRYFVQVVAASVRVKGDYQFAVAY